MQIIVQKCSIFWKEVVMSNQKHRALRKRITNILPKSLVVPARKFAMNIDRILGMPFSPFRKGVIAMLHVGRSGSTVLGGLLDQNPHIWWDGEIYHNQAIYNGLPSKQFNSEKWLRKQFSKSGKKFYGFEFKPLADQHLSFIEKSLDEYLCELKKLKVTHYILLKRNNYLRRMVSQYVGSKSGKRHVNINEKQGITKVKIDVKNAYFGDRPVPKSLVECFQEIDEAYALVEKTLADEKILVLSYEDDILKAGPIVAYEKVCSFLGLSPSKVQVKIGRTNPFPLEEIIENYEDIVKTLSTTKYSWMLSD